jgi:tRNA (cytidine/uridine-2'-O-)-methyltransferase
MPALALYQPDIPQNAGTILRLCACLDVEAHVIEPAGFDLSDRSLRRAGMDYLTLVRLIRHRSWADFAAWRAGSGRRLILLTTSGVVAYTEFAFAPEDVILLGRESAGVPDTVHATADARLLIPMAAGLRSLNVATAAAMVLGEGLRQTNGFPVRVEASRL